MGVSSQLLSERIEVGLSKVSIASVYLKVNNTRTPGFGNCYNHFR